MAEEGSPPDTQSPESSPSHRKACDSCHAAKVRCALARASISGACRRCTKHGFRCRHSSPEAKGRRKPPAATQSRRWRIADLERRVHGLFRNRGINPPASLVNREPADPHSRQPARDDGLSDAPSYSTPNVKAPARPAPAAAAGPNAGADHTASPPLYKDVVDRGIITAAQADELMLTFHSHLEGGNVGVWLPKGLSRPKIRRSMPILWLGILCASTGTRVSDSHLARVLAVEMDDVLARITPASEPSIEILRAIFIYTIHHYEPTHNRLNQFLHHFRLAMAMATRLATSELLEAQPDDLDAPTDAKFNIAREFLSWHWCNMVVAMRTRETPLPWSDELVQRSLQIVEKSQESIDRGLLAWLSLARITLNTATNMDAGVGGSRQAVMQQFEERLRKWSDECPEDVTNEQLLIEYNFSIIFISEIEYPAPKDDNDLRVCRTLPLLDAPLSGQEMLVPWRDRIPECVRAAHAILDTFTGLEPDQLRRVAITAFSRVFHALRILFHIFYLVLAGAQLPASVGSLKTESYVDALSRCLLRAAHGSRCKAPAIWLYALQSRLLPWYKELCQKANQSPIFQSLVQSPEAESHIIRSTPTKPKDTLMWCIPDQPSDPSPVFPNMTLLKDATGIVEGAGEPYNLLRIDSEKVLNLVL